MERKQCFLGTLNGAIICTKDTVVYNVNGVLVGFNKNEIFDGLMEEVKTVIKEKLNEDFVIPEYIEKDKQSIVLKNAVFDFVFSVGEVEIIYNEEKIQITEN